MNPAAFKRCVVKLIEMCISVKPYMAWTRQILPEVMKHTIPITKLAVRKCTSLWISDMGQIFFFRLSRSVTVVSMNPYSNVYQHVEE